MSFRTGAVLFLLSAASLFAAWPCADLPDPTVGVLLRFDRPPQPRFVPLLRLYVEHIFHPAGLKFHWGVFPANDVCGHRTVTVDLRGFCGPTLRPASGLGGGTGELPLGWTFVLQSEVSSHSVLDCDHLAQAVLGMGFGSARREWQDVLYARLAARVLAHELMHTLLQTSGHSAADLTRSPLRPADLNTLPSLTPTQITALRRIVRAAPPLTTASRKRPDANPDRPLPHPTPGLQTAIQTRTTAVP